MATTVLTVEVHVLDTRRALWCPHCNLPSVVEVDCVLVWPATLRVFHRFTGSTCTECDR